MRRIGEPAARWSSSKAGAMLQGLAYQGDWSATRYFSTRSIDPTSRVMIASGDWCANKALGRLIQATERSGSEYLLRNAA